MLPSVALGARLDTISGAHKSSTKTMQSQQEHWAFVLYSPVCSQVSQPSSHPWGLVPQEGWLQPTAENSRPKLCMKYKNWDPYSNIPKDTACRTAIVLPRAGLVTWLSGMVPGLCQSCVGTFRSVQPFLLQPRWTHGIYPRQTQISILFGTSSFH